MDGPVAGAAGESVGGPQRPRLTGWRRVLVVIGMVAFGLRLLLALLMHAGGHGSAAATTAEGARIVQWPVQAGDVFWFQPGDKNLAAWENDPKTEDLGVSKVVPGGNPAVPNTVECVFDPGYVGAIGQPGGRLTVEGHDLIVGWRVHWQGGDTVPFVKKPDLRCGQDVELLLTATQMHDLVNALQGLPQPPPEPDGVPVGTTIPLPQK